MSTATLDSRPPKHLIPALPPDHPTATVYLDESGVVKTDRFFGIGCLKVANGPDLTRALYRRRQKLQCYDEIHWSRLDKASARGGRTFDLARAAMEIFFDVEGASFCCTVADRENGDLPRSYGSSWNAYEGLSIDALEASIGPAELVSVMADHVDTPPGVTFEEAIASGVNRHRSRLAITTVTRVHSHAVDGLQLADLLLGAAMFDFRQGALGKELQPGSQKAELCRFLLDESGVPTFRPAGKTMPGKIKVEMKKRKRTRRRRRGGDPT